MAARQSSKQQQQAVSRLLRKRREQAGLSQRALADVLGIDHSAVAKVETGVRGISVTEFIAWVRACGGDPAEAISSIPETA